MSDRVRLRRRPGRVECPLPLIYRRKPSNRLRPAQATLRPSGFRHLGCKADGRKSTRSRRLSSYRGTWSNVCIRAKARLSGETAMGAKQKAVLRLARRLESQSSSRIAAGEHWKPPPLTVVRRAQPITIFRGAAAGGSNQKLPQEVPSACAWIEVNMILVLSKVSRCVPWHWKTPTTSQGS